MQSVPDIQAQAQKNLALLSDRLRMNHQGSHMGNRGNKGQAILQFAIQPTPSASSTFNLQNPPTIQVPYLSLSTASHLSHLQFTFQPPPSPSSSYSHQNLTNLSPHMSSYHHGPPFVATPPFHHITRI